MAYGIKEDLPFTHSAAACSGFLRVAKSLRHASFLTSVRHASNFCASREKGFATRFGLMQLWVSMLSHDPRIKPSALTSAVKAGNSEP